MVERCTSRKSNGEPCQGWRLAGSDKCNRHLPNPASRVRAAVRAELSKWGLGDSTVDPGEVLLRLVSQSATRAGHYATLLEEAYDAAERLREAHRAHELILPDPDDFDPDAPELADVQAARADFDRLFKVGGVAALVGNTYAATSDGSVYATGEAIRGLAALEAQERDRCANFAAKAIAAGLAERQVKLAEQQGALIADVFRKLLSDPELGLTEEQRRMAPGVVRRILALAG